MDIETDSETFDGRVDVITKTCKKCGVKFIVAADHKKRMICDACKAEAERKHKRVEAAKARDSATDLWREQERQRAEEAALRKERQRKRDADWERFESENGRQVVVQERDTVIVENRGRVS